MGPLDRYTAQGGGHQHDRRNDLVPGIANHAAHDVADTFVSTTDAEFNALNSVFQTRSVSRSRSVRAHSAPRVPLAEGPGLIARSVAGHPSQ